MEFYNLDKKEVFLKLNSSLNGLSEDEAQERLKKYGLNYLEKEKKLSGLKIFLSQFNDVIIYILGIAIIISLVLHEIIDSIVIGAILFLNACFGFIQEYKAEKSIQLLRKLSSPKAEVIRNGKYQTIDSKELVPGDIVIIEAGDKISADGRLIETIDLQVDESILTGESTPVLKHIKPLSKERQIAEQANMVFSGTTVTSGRAKFIVTSTNMKTEIGKIAHLVQTTVDTATPLEKKMKNLGYILSAIVVLVALVILFLGIFNGLGTYNALLTSISLAVAAIPEGLPAVVTICLALGVQRMHRKNALVRKLKSIETLGSTDIICADKTGTITKNEMTVKQIFVNNNLIDVTGEGYDTEGHFLFKNKKIDSEKFKVLLEIAASCNNAVLPEFGDPTEIALLVMAKKGKVDKIEDRIHEVPFSSEKKYMMTTHVNHKGEITYIKGAPENVLSFCKYYYLDGKEKLLTNDDKKKILDINCKMAEQAFRVLSMAYKKKGKTVFVGLAGMMDPPREEVKGAVKLCNNAGIKVIMITGDHKITAEAVAKRVGITGETIEGKELDNLNDKEFNKIVEKIGIYARVNPEHKVRILKALQEKGHIVAMTGDGVNDAPALKRADVGVAMNIKGTDVARSASDMILLDDNFATIVNAIKEGRVIGDNIKKFIKFLLSSNFGELFLIVFALLIKIPLPLLPLQILWINLMTDGLPALALSIDNPEKDIMKRKPNGKGNYILKGVTEYIIIAGLLATIVSLVGYSSYFNVDLDKARTIVLTIVILFELFWVFSCRSEKFTIFESDHNKWLYLAVILSISLHVAMMYGPFASLFNVVALNLNDWLKVIGLSCIGFVLFESKKLIFRAKSI